MEISYVSRFYDRVTIKELAHKGTSRGVLRRPQNSPQDDDKNMMENFGNLFVKCMLLVTNGYLYHLLRVSDYYVIYGQRAQSALRNVFEGHQLGY